MNKVVILLNLGGIYSQKDAREFLKNMFYDEDILTIKNPFLRKTLANIIINLRINSTKKIYSYLENGSRILSITQNLVDKLNQNKEKIIFDYAFNYSKPYFKEVFEKYKNAKQIVLFPLFPQYSTTTSLSALKKARAILKELSFKGQTKEIQSFYNDEAFDELIVNQIKKHYKKGQSLIFSAHSLPVKIIQNGDPYLKQTLKHFELLKKELLIQGFEFDDFILSFQSKLGPIKWLEPSTIDIIKNLKSKNALIYPISFCIDNSETDYELKIAYKDLAKELNYENYEVVEALNDSDEFVNYILNKVLLI